MRSRIAFRLPFILFLLLTLLAPSRRLTAQSDAGDGVYYVQSLSRIELTGDVKSPFEGNDSSSNLDYWTRSNPRSAVLENAGDVYLQFDDAFSRFSQSNVTDYKMAIRLDEPADVTGTLYIPVEWQGPLHAFRFSIKADQFTASQNDYLNVKLSHYQHLWHSQQVGAAWFRYQANQISSQLGKSDSVEDDPATRNDWQAQMELNRSLSLVSGGMALSENLQLDRMLTIGAGEDKTTFPIDRIEGITIAEFDWRPLVKDISPNLDTLASHIPADQHVMFVPSFEALVTLIETGFKTAGPLFPLLSETAESANTRERYQQQLGLPLGKIQKMLGPTLISSIAITGGDPYFRTGTDLAVLFEATEPAALEKAIQATIAISVASSSVSKVEEVSGTAGNIPYSGYCSPDRQICSYVATLGNVVVVTNSLVQLNRLVEVRNHPESALLKLDEYKFFRDRYRLGDENETALIIITDQTIRRWCGPRWRIATSRRTRAAAVLNDLHARYLRQLADGISSPISVDIGESVFALNQFTVVDHAASSPTYGTLEFQTPVSELEIKRVSGRERTAYENWRRGYQSNWSNVFDPIAIRLSMMEEKLAADLTVMPLINNSEYQSMIGASRGAKLNAMRNAPHAEALAWAALALNTDSPMLTQWANMGSSFARVNFMDWLGDAAIIFVDEDAFWTDLQKAIGEDFDQEDFFQDNLHRLPVALQFNVKSSFRLTAFLVGLRGFIEQAAPDMTVWETMRHRDTAYVKISPSTTARRDIPVDLDANIALHYFASGDTLIFSLSESVIQRAIDRRLDADPDQPNDPPTKATANANSLPLLGDNLAVQVKRSLAIGMVAMSNRGYQRHMQRQSWTALPILNEWKRLFPDRDPLDIDRIVWKRELSCPSGGEYRWNDEFKTMESSVYGHPAGPKNGPHATQILGSWETGNFGLTFENQGLRAIFELIQPPAHQTDQDPGQ